jgi:hypothetical protein
MSEYLEHKQVCQYILFQHPDAIFFSDLSGIKMSIGLAVKIKSLKSSRAIPDLFIAEPRGIYNGLFIEMKKTGEKIFKKDLITPVNDHVAEQMQMLQRLREKGYYAKFAIGFNDAIDIINYYFSFKKT